MTTAREVPDDISGVPLDQPIGAKPSPHRRPDALAPAPVWVAWVFVVLAVLLLPWLVFLAFTLPDRNLSEHYDLAWVGFDVALAVSMFVTGLNAWRRSTWVQNSASATATLLLTDAWFDVTTAGGGRTLLQSLLAAALLELPLALLSLWIARHAEEVRERATLWLLRRSEHQAAQLQAEHGALAQGTYHRPESDDPHAELATDTSDVIPDPAATRPQSA